MPRHITEAIQELAGRIPLENNQTNDQSPTAAEMQRRAQAAILAGQLDTNGAITAEWRAYMTFLLGGAAANPDDLRRLLPEPGTGFMDTDRQQERTYLVGNGMCGTGTGAVILNRGNPTFFLDQD